MLHCVVCDDELPALELMRSMLEEIGEVTIGGAFQAVGDAMAYVERGSVDLLVMDVEMPGMTGIEAFKSLSLDPKPLLILATAHPEYALDAFDVDAIDFLVKPFDADRVAKAVEKASRLHRLISASKPERVAPSEGEGGSLAIKNGSSVFLIPHGEIQWIEAAGDYSLVHTADREHAMRSTVTALESQLPPEQFVRVHRSSIVNVAAVDAVRTLPKGDAVLHLKSGREVKASRSYRDAVRTISIA